MGRGMRRIIRWWRRWRGSLLCCLLWIVVGIGFLLD